jgi:hypothetical protein
MSSRGFTHLQPLLTGLARRTLALGLYHLPGKQPLEAKRAPRAVRRDVLGSQLEEQQLGYDRHRAFNAIRLASDLMLPQPHNAFEFLHERLDQSSLQIAADNLPRGHGFRQIGHEELGLSRVIVTPAFTAHHRDVSHMAQPYMCGIDPKGRTALRVDGRNLNLGILAV